MSHERNNVHDRREAGSPKLQASRDPPELGATRSDHLGLPSRICLGVSAQLKFFQTQCFLLPLVGSTMGMSMLPVPLVVFLVLVFPVS